MTYWNDLPLDEAAVRSYPAERPCPECARKVPVVVVCFNPGHIAYSGSCGHAWETRPA